MTAWWSLALVLLGGVIGAFANVWMKIAAGQISFSPRTWFSRRVIRGIGSYVISAALYILALQGGSLSVLYPVWSLSFAWTAIVSHKMLGESLGRKKVVGILLILLGVFLVGFTS